MDFIGLDKMLFFKHDHVIKKLKEDAETLEKTLDYVDEQLSSPCQIYSIESCWPAEKLLRKDLDDVKAKRMEIEDCVMRNKANTAKIKVFRRSTAHFIKAVDAHLNDFHTQLMKYGMKPMPGKPAPQKDTNAMNKLANGLEKGCKLRK